MWEGTKFHLYIWAKIQRSIKNEKTPDKKKTQEEKKKARIIKTSVFKELVKGEKKHCHKFVHPNEISDDDSHFFFAILLQPFSWKFPWT